MRRDFIYKICFTVLAGILGLSGCQKPFNEEYNTLELAYTKFNLAREGGEFSFMVYYSGDWTIEVEDEMPDWFRLEMTSGHGITPVHVSYDENFSFKRSFTLLVKGGGETRSIVCTQGTAISTPVIRFQEDALVLAGQGGRVRTRILANMSDKHLSGYKPEISWDFGEASQWISNFGVIPIAEDYIIDQGTSLYPYYICFDIAENTTGQNRIATVSYRMNDDSGKLHQFSIQVSQGAEKGNLSIKGEVVRGSEGGEFQETLEGGLERYQDAITWDVSPDGSFVSGLRVQDGKLFYTLTKNTDASPREVSVSLKYDGIETATIRIVQKESGVGPVYDIRTVQELLAWNKDAANWTEEDHVILHENIDCYGLINSSDWALNDFKGIFDGNGKTIDNFIIEKTGKAAFFNSISGEALVKDLTFGGGCAVTTKGKSGKVSAAMLATVLKDKACLKNVIVRGKVTASDEAAGTSNGSYIGGLCSEMTSEGTVEGCENHADVTFSVLPKKWTNVGGVFGQVSGAEGKLINCKNYGRVEFSGESNNGQSVNLAGIAAGASVVQFESCTNYGTVVCSSVKASTGGTNIGGIVGISNSAHCGDILNCANEGRIQNTGLTSGRLSMGGCIGYQQNVALNIRGFRNTGDIRNDFATESNVMIGGVAGYLYPTAVVHSLVECVNEGDVISKSKAGDKEGGIGGVVGLFKGQNASGSLEILDCGNEGDVTMDSKGTGNCHVGGVIGAIAGQAEASVRGCDNSGAVINGTSTDVTDKWIYTGGVIGYYGIAEGELVDCTNSGDVISSINSSATDGRVRLGGIAGNVDICLVEGCVNEGTVKDASSSVSVDMGGILGRFNCSVASYMKSCKNEGTLLCENTSDDAASGYIAVGGLVATIAKNTLIIEACGNASTLKNSSTALGKEKMGGIVANAAKGVTIRNCTSDTIIDSLNEMPLNTGLFGGYMVMDCNVAESFVSGTVNGKVVSGVDYQYYSFGAVSPYADVRGLGYFTE